MINTVVIMGRITQDLELRQTPSGVSALSFTVAVDRGYQKPGEERQADFIACVAWRQTAEFISRYFGKGRMIALTGELRSRTYDDKNGSRHYITEVYVDQASFTGEKKQEGSYQPSSYSSGTEPKAARGPEWEAENRAHARYSPDPQPQTQQKSAAFEDRELEIIEEFGVISDDGVPF